VNITLARGLDPSSNPNPSSHFPTEQDIYTLWIMSLFKRRLRYARNLFQEKDDEKRAILQAIVNQQRLELRSFKYKVNQEIKFTNETNKGGYILERSVKKKFGSAVTQYVVRVFQASWHTLDHSVHDDDQEDHIRHGVDQEELESIAVTNAKGKSFTQFPGIRSIDPEAKQLILEFLEDRACFSRTASASAFGSLSCLKLVTQVGVIKKSRAKGGSLPEAQIGDTFQPNEMVNKQLPLVDYLSECLHVKKYNKMMATQAGVDMLQSIQRNEENLERKKMSNNDERMKMNAAGEEAGAAMALAIKHKNEQAARAELKMLQAEKSGAKPSQVAELRAKVEKLQREAMELHRMLKTWFISSLWRYVREQFTKVQKKEMSTLALAPAAPGGWTWPCSSGRHLRVDIDVFIGGTDETEIGQVESKEMKEMKEKKGEKKKHTSSAEERTFTTNVSVNDPILSIVHFLSCWFSFDNLPGGEEHSSSMRLPNIELLIKIRTHANEKILRVDTWNKTSRKVTRDAFATAWDLLHRSGSHDTGLEIIVSVLLRSEDQPQVPSLSVAIRVSDIEHDPMVLVEMPIGCSLLQARQLITDCVVVSSAKQGCDDDEDDMGEDAHEWRMLQALSSSNDYTFSKQGASVTRSAEFKIAALKLSVIEGSRLFHQHSQSEELCLVLLPSMN